MAQKVAGGRKTVGIGDRVGLVHELEIGVGRHKILADSLDRPASRFWLASGLDQWGEHRADRVRENHARRCRILCHETADTGQRSA